MINWIAVKEASFEEMRQKWESLPKELRYAAYGGAGGSALAMLIHRLMGTDHRKGRTIGWGAIGALTGGAGGAVTGYTERKITPYIKTLADNINGSVEGYKNNINNIQEQTNNIVNFGKEKINDVVNTARDEIVKTSGNANKTIDEARGAAKGVNRTSNAVADVAEFLANQFIGKAKWIDRNVFRHR